MYPNTLLLILFLVQLFCSWSLTVRWIGLTGNPSWSVSDNWYCGALNRTCVPQAVDDVIIHPSTSCSQCIRNIVILNNTSAVCNSITVVADGNPISLSIQSSSLAIGATAQFGLGSTLYVQQATVTLVNLDAKFSSDDTVVIDGGSLSGNSYVFSNVNISSTANLYNATIQNLQFTPYSPDLDCSLGGQQIVVNGKSFAYSTIILSNVNLGQFTYKPLNPNYTLDFGGNIEASTLDLYGGIVSFDSGTANFGNINLYGGVQVYVLGAFVSSTTVSGSGTINVNFGSFSANVSNYVTSFNVNCGTLQLGGTHVGNIVLAYSCYPVLYLTSSGMIINQLVSLYKATLQGNGNQVYFNNLNLSYLSVFNCQMNLVNSLNPGPFQNAIYIDLNNNANFSTNIGSFNQGNYYFQITGNGYFINNGNWICNYGLDISVPIIGTGTWYIMSGAVASLYGASTVFESIIVDGTVSLYGSNSVVNQLSGGNYSSLNMYGSSYTFNNLSIVYLTDYSDVGLTYNNFKIVNYNYQGDSELTFVSGKIQLLVTSTPASINFKSTAQVDTFNATDHIIINSEMILPINRFTFTSGELYQTGAGGVLNVATETYFLTDSPKVFGTTTVLQTPNLNCQCPTPDCGITTNDWNHIQAGQTSGCLI